MALRSSRRAKTLAVSRKQPELVDSCRPAYEDLKWAIHNDMILITGPPSVGKRTITMKIFEEKKNISYAYVNCYSVTTPTYFYSAICQSFQKNLDIRPGPGSSKAKLPQRGKPVASHEFVQYFSHYLDQAKKKKIDRLFVILDHVEVFQKTNLMTCFTTLASVRHLNIIILSYEYPSDLVHYATRISKTAGIRLQDRLLPISVPIWTKQDTIDWILSFPPRKEVDLYRKFVSNIVRLAHMNDNNNPTQTRLYCQDNFEDFLSHYQGSMGKTTFQNSVTGFLRSFNSFNSNINSKKLKIRAWTATDSGVRLPLNTSILIIAAYVAAYTKPNDDKRNFVRLQKKTKQTDSKPEHISRPFTFERLYHIYKALMRILQSEACHDVIHDNGFVLGDVERLEDINFLIHQSGWSVHPEARYKLSPCVKHEYVARLAENIDLDLSQLYGLSIQNLL